MRELKVPFLLLALTIALVGCSTKSIKDSTAEESHSFSATVLEVHDRSLLVSPAEESWERGISDRIEVPLKYRESWPLPQVGDVVNVVYAGEILESYPASATEICRVEILSADGWESGGTPVAPVTPEKSAEWPDDFLQDEFHESYGNLNLATLLDLSARYGENLTWETFAPYFCEETAGEIYTMKFRVNSDLYLLVGGDPESDPEFVRLMLQADPKVFVDMRTGNVEEFLKQHNLGK